MSASQVRRICANWGSAGGNRPSRTARVAALTSVRPSIDRATYELVAARHVEKTFRVTDEQPAARLLQIRHSVKQRALRRFVEIDDDIAAKYDVERSFHRPRIEQIQLLEGDQRFELGRRRLEAGASRDLRDRFLEGFGLRAAEALLRVLAFGGGRHYVRVDVRGEKLDVPPRQMCEHFPHDDGERIR